MSDLVEWLERHGLGRYAGVFAEHDIPFWREFARIVGGWCAARFDL